MASDSDGARFHEGTYAEVDEAIPPGAYSVRPVVIPARTDDNTSEKEVQYCGTLAFTIHGPADFKGYTKLDGYKNLPLDLV